VIEIEVEGNPGRELASAINAIIGRRAMGFYGRRLRRSARERIRAERDVDGFDFEPLSEQYAARKRGPGILRETLELYRTLEVRPRNGEADVGTPLTRGLWHNRGTPRMPARTWLGVTEEDVTEIGSIAERLWEEHFAG